MRNLIIGVAAAFLAVAAPAVASADTGGAVRFTYADTDQDNVPSKEDVVAFSGVVMTDVGSNWRVQFNGTSADADAYGSSYNHSQVEVHAIYNGFGPVAVGGFTGLYDDGSGNGFLLLGVEASGDIGPVHLSASASTGEARNGNQPDVDNIGVQASMGVMQNLSLYVEGSWSDFGGPFGEVDAWGAGFNYNIPNTDFMVGVGYRNADVEWNSGDTEFIGVTFGWRFGDDMGNGYMPGARGLIADGIAWD